MSLNQSNQLTYLKIAFVLLFLGTSCTKKIFAQSPTVPYQRDYVAKAPNATTFNKYGDIDVGLFTGSPNIRLPIYTTRDVENPISLSLHYSTSGIKPEQHHDWVGTGWNLTTGGSITRIKHGDYDERKVASQAQLQGQMSYMDNCWRLNNSWNSDRLELVMRKVCTGNACLADTAIFKTRFADLEPDEFAFNFQGHSGTIMLNHQGTWVFRTNNGEVLKLKSLKPIIVENYLPGRPNYAAYTLQTIIPNPRVIIGFTLVTNDGTEYQFGGNYSSVEFSYNLQAGNANTEIWPITWHLNKIIPVSGKEIILGYEKDQFHIVTNVVRNKSAIVIEYGWFKWRTQRH